MYEGVTPSPDPGFIRKLKEFDPKLRCRFDRDLERFIIEQPRKVGGWAIACVVRSQEDYNFAYPDNRHIQILYEADFQRRSAEKRIVEGEDRIHKYREDQEAEERSEIHDRTKDSKIQLMNAFKRHYNLGKPTSAFRQITVKPKGYIVKDKRKLQAS